MKPPRGSLADLARMLLKRQVSATTGDSEEKIAALDYAAQSFWRAFRDFQMAA